MEKLRKSDSENEIRAYGYDVEVKSSGVEYDLDIDAITGKIKLEKQSTDTHIRKTLLPKVRKKHSVRTTVKVAESVQPRVADAKLLTSDHASAVKTQTVNQANKVVSTKQAMLTQDQAIAIAKKKANGTVTKV